MSQNATRESWLLGDLVRFEGGGTPPRNVPEYWNGDIPWATVKDCQDVTLTETQEYITEAGLEKSSSRLVPAGTLIIPTRMALGKALITTIDVAINQDLRAVYPVADLDRRYLLWFFLSNAHRIEAMGSGATVKGITQDKLRSLKVPLPSLSEQKRIAAILDKADDIRRKRQESLRLTNEFLRSVFLDMFGDPISNPKGWRKSTLGELATVERGRFSPRPRNDPSFYNGRYPFIQTGDIADSGGQIRTWRQTLNERGIGVSRSFPKGAIVMAIVGATIGRTAILNFESYCPDSVVGIQPKPEKATPSYVEYALRMRRGELLSRAPETARANLNLEILRPFPILQPPIELQHRFSNIVLRVNEQRQRNEAALCHADRLFSALQRDAFGNRLKSAGAIPVTASKMTTPEGDALAKPP